MQLTDMNTVTLHNSVVMIKIIQFRSFYY